MIPLTLYFLANLTLAGGPYEAYGILAPLTKEGCDRLADRDHVCVRLQMPKRDPRCDGAGRYQAMADGDRSGWGTGHACQRLNIPNRSKR